MIETESKPKHFLNLFEERNEQDTTLSGPLSEAIDRARKLASARGHRQRVRMWSQASHVPNRGLPDTYGYWLIQDIPDEPPC